MTIRIFLARFAGATFNKGCVIAFWESETSDCDRPCILLNIGRVQGIAVTGLGAPMYISHRGTGESISIYEHQACCGHTVKGHSPCSFLIADQVVEVDTSITTNVRNHGVKIWGVNLYNVFRSFDCLHS